MQLQSICLFVAISLSLISSRYRWCRISEFPFLRLIFQCVIHFAYPFILQQALGLLLFYLTQCTNLSLRPWFSLFEYILRSRTAYSHENSIFHSLRSHHTIFHSSYTISHSHQQSTNVPISLRPHQHFFFNISHCNGYEVI